MKKMINKKMIVLVVFLLTCLSILGNAEEQRTVSLDETIALAIKNSDTLSYMQTKLTKKGIDLIQAKEDIESEKNEIKELEKEIIYTKIKIKYDVVIAYMDMVLEMEKLKDYKKTLEESKERLSSLEKDFKIGKASKKDIEAMKQEIDGSISNIKKSTLIFENKKEVLGMIVGLDMKKEDDFEKDFSYKSIPKKFLENMREYAIEHDFELYKVEQKKKREQEKINEFVTKHEDKIVIPQEWIEGKNYGLKDVEDEGYTLIGLLLERDQAKKEEEKIKKDLEQKINNTYNQVQLLEISYLDGLEKIKKNKEAHEKAIKDNKIGKITKEELENIKKEVEKSERASFLNLVTYKKAVERLNLTTSGAVESLKNKFASDEL
ncbi:hypothetical protein [Crassaminicella profunda]|uniref:hypothetical protein n=1 Tax=Crassaminicella profunda TaxID=1286698 RepID=UPI001CA6FBD0|nr:hypothetical protein [Crassaminicella profunda]QZY54462.1 hypothetical protein K7H06_15665 [Crassaminicella profunda]